jgi:predicted transposase/invertase (TIGR01784 family)
MRIFMEKGIKKDRNEGIDKGRDEGMKRGTEKSKIQIAINLLKEGFDRLMISKITGLPIEKIECLKIL